jgi:hypothetical protein
VVALTGGAGAEPQTKKRALIAGYSAISARAA